jgi:hypothetical protein
MLSTSKRNCEKRLESFFDLKVKGPRYELVGDESLGKIEKRL